MKHKVKRPSDLIALERRVRNLERNGKKDAKTIAHYVARMEIEQSMAQHEQSRHFADVPFAPDHAKGSETA